MRKNPKNIKDLPRGPTGPRGVLLNPSSFWGSTAPDGESDPVGEEIGRQMAQDAYEKMLASLKLIERDDETEAVLRAKYHMALVYRYGWGQPVNFEKAIHLYQEAAAGGLAQATNEVARLYIQGHELMGR